MKIINTSGKRKTAIARASLREGSGIVRVNKILLDYFQPKLYRLKLQEPLILAGELSGRVDIDINITGGGISAQADAARVAISNALVGYSKSDKLKEIFLKYDRSLLVSDVRRKETRKPGRHGKARSKTQKSYR